MSTNDINAQSVQENSFVTAVEWLDEIGSTNSHAIETISQREEFPLLIGADQQTFGRGRGANAWWAATGSLTFSLVLAPNKFNIAQQHWPLLSLSVGYAISNGLTPYIDDSSIQLKWPNDVYLNGKKLCGILIETIPALPELLVIGIGLNVNNSLADAPDDVKSRAISLTDVLNQPVPREEVLFSILQALHSTLVSFSLDKEEMFRQWRSICYLTGKQVSIENSNSTTTGFCMGIDDDGALRIMTPAGEQRILAGTVNIMDE